jgi:hypothetical protein
MSDREAIKGFMSDVERREYQEKMEIRDRVQNKVEDILGFITANNPKAQSLTTEENNLDYFLWTMDLGNSNTSNALRFDLLYRQIASQVKGIDEDRVVNRIVAELIPKDRINFKEVDGIPVFLGLNAG